MHTDFATRFTDFPREWHDRVAFRDGDDARTFGELLDAAARCSGALRTLGVQPGDRVAALLSTSVDLVVAMLGAYRAGAVYVPVNTRYGPSEIRHILSDSGARVVLVDADGPAAATLAGVPLPDTVEATVRVGPGGDFSDRLAAAVGPPAFSIDDDDIALLMYTSGTTGRSKGVEIPYRAIGSGIDALTRLWEWCPADRLVLALPLFHVHGLGIGVHGTLLRGCTTVLHRRFDPDDVADAIAAGGTIFMGVPTMYSRLVTRAEAAPDVAAKLSRARLFTSGSAALSPYLFVRFERATGHRILERYGMTETMLTLSNPLAGERRPGTVGRAVPGCEVRVVDDAFETCAPGELGQVIVRGPSLFSGYRGLPAATTESFRDGWFVTGDIAVVDDDGYVAIRGRRSVDILKVGGFKISAREIEEALELHPSVAEAAVIGLPDEEWGQQIAAALVPAPTAPDDDDLWLEHIQVWSRSRLADYKTVRVIRRVDALPRNALGKVQKHRLQDAFGTPTGPGKRDPQSAAPATKRNPT